MLRAEMQRLRILALDTSTRRGSVALLEGPAVVAELRLDSEQTHSARLLRGIDLLLETAGWDLRALRLVAAGIGPGSFTGIRIGVATALGLAQSLDVPYAGVSGFDALASQLHPAEPHLAVLLDAQRSQVYFAEYLVSPGGPKLASPPSLHAPAELATRLQGRRMAVAGDALPAYASALGIGRGARIRIVEADLFLAASIGKVAWKRRAVWRSGDRLRSEPLYVRPPDARRPRPGKS